MTYEEALDVINNGGGYILSDVERYEYAMYTARKALLNRIGEETGGEVGKKADPNVMTYGQALHELTHARTLFMKDDIRKRYHEAKNKAEEALRVEVDMETTERGKA